MKDFIFNKLLPQNLNADGTIQTLRQFNQEFKTKNKLFYPSAGNDTTDLVYVNDTNLSELQDISPSIFIHSDFRTTVDQMYGSDKTLIYPNFSIQEYFHLWGDAQKSITIMRLLDNNNNNLIWLIYFSGYYNEEILKFLISEKIQVNIVYSVCDGITYGMGGCNREAVPTILYPLIAKHIQLKYIITEQSYDKYVKMYFEFVNTPKRFRRWLTYINLIVSDEELQALQQLDNYNFITNLQKILEDIKETRINSYRKTRIYDERYGHLLVLKQLF
jgi:hypothetical protein